MLAAEPAFDAIHVGAAADELHQVLLDKLAPGGRMVIPVGPRYSYQASTQQWDSSMCAHVCSHAAPCLCACERAPWLTVPPIAAVPACSQVLMAVDKDAAGAVSTHALMDVGYVPLTRPSELEDGALPRV